MGWKRTFSLAGPAGDGVRVWLSRGQRWARLRERGAFCPLPPPPRLQPHLHSPGQAPFRPTPHSQVAREIYREVRQGS